MYVPGYYICTRQYTLILIIYWCLKPLDSISVISRLSFIVAGNFREPGENSQYDASHNNPISIRGATIKLTTLVTTLDIDWIGNGRGFSVPK